MSLIGIDLGTSYSRVAVYHRGLIKVVQDELHGRTISSCVAFTPEERLIGKVAKQQMKKNPKNTIYGSKRLIGKSYQEVQELKSVEGLPFDLENCEGKPKIRVQYRGQTKQLYPEEISAMVLSRLKDIVSKKVKVSGAVITVPASFNIAQRKATCDAAKIAGIEVLGLINETTAVALAYRLRDQKEFVARNALVLHVGVGTFDVSVVTIGENALKVKASIGNSRLGGENFTLRLFDKFCRKYQVDVKSNPADACKLRIACEEMKSGLGDSNEASVEVVINKVRQELVVTQETFNKQTHQYFQQIKETIHQALCHAQVSEQQINDVLVTGGSAGMTVISDMMGQLGFEGKVRAVDIDEDAAYGAAALAALIRQDEDFRWKGFAIQDVFSQSVFCVESIFQCGSSIPQKRDICWKCKAGQHEVKIVNEERVVGENVLTLRPHAVGIIKINATTDESAADWQLLMNRSGLLRIITTLPKTQMKLEVGLSIEEIKLSSRESEVYRAEDIKREEVMKTLYDLEKQTDRLHSKCEKILRWLREVSDPSREEIEKNRKALSDILNNMSNTRKSHARTQTEDVKDIPVKQAQQESDETKPRPFEEEEKEEFLRKLSNSLSNTTCPTTCPPLVQPHVQQMKRDDHTVVSMRQKQLEKTNGKLMEKVKLLQEESEELSKKLNRMELIPQEKYKKELEARNSQLMAEVKELQTMSLKQEQLEASNAELIKERKLLQDETGNLERNFAEAEQKIKELKKAERDSKEP